jgi:hypothetical protein
MEWEDFHCQDGQFPATQSHLYASTYCKTLQSRRLDFLRTIARSLKVPNAGDSCRHAKTPEYRLWSTEI